MVSNFGWNSIAKIYDFVAGEIDEQLYGEVIRSLGNLDNLLLDEFGCGTGNLTIKFPKTVKVRAIDYSPNAIEIARKKTKDNITFYVMDFYRKRLEGRADKIVACRSMYNPDLSRSMEILSNQVNDGGLVIIAHPRENLRRYLFPRIKRKKTLSVNHLVKSMNRVMNNMNLIDYSLFHAEKFKEIGRRHFNEVDVKLAGYETHYIVSLIK